MTKELEHIKAELKKRERNVSYVPKATLFRWLASLLVTIESQKEEIEQLEDERDEIRKDYESACEMSSWNSSNALRLQDELTAQKDITDLAEDKLRELQTLFDGLDDHSEKLLQRNNSMKFDLDEKIALIGSFQRNHEMDLYYLKEFRSRISKESGIYRELNMRIKRSESLSHTQEGDKP